MGRITTLSPDTLKKIADYFGVSLDVLLGRDTSKDVFPDTITLIARAGKKMTPEQQLTLLKFAQFSFPEAFEDDE